jgi:fatty acid desaturase
VNIMKRTIPIDPQLVRDLRLAVADLKEIDPWAGFVRFASLGCITLGLTALSWHTAQMGWFGLGAIATGLSYVFWLLCNHDATHRSLTGWNWFDTLMPRVISWPMLWPVGTYNQLHQLHHGWNGIDLRDPERVEWTEAEYQTAPAWQRWYVRHQWLMDVFVLGGVGLIARTVRQGFLLQRELPRLRSQMTIDAVGMIIVQGSILSLIHSQGISLWKYLLFWVLLERSIGIVVQMREHIEHYGLWQQTDNYQLTQLYACRNLATYKWVNWLMGALPYHSVHHAFPQIPGYHLAEAFERIQAVLQRYHLPPMVLAPGYLASSFELAKHPSQIALEKESSSKIDSALRLKLVRASS